MITDTNLISVTRNESYDKEEIIASIREHFKRLGVDKKLTSDMRVLIKPNLVMKRKPEDFTTTHPLVVGGVIAVLKEMGISDIVIADSPGGQYAKVALSGIYETCGMKKTAEEYGVSLNNDFGSFERKCENSKLVSSFTLINPVKDSDYIINVCKMKTHTMATISGAVKNYFGTIPGLMKPELHWRFPDKNDFCEMLVDLCQTVNPDLNIVDAIVSMQGNGPTGGTAVKTNMLLASENPYNLDVALCEAMNVKLSDAPTVQKAIERNLSVRDFSELSFVGEGFERFKNFQMPDSKNIDFLDRVPKPFRGIAAPVIKNLFASKPKINHKKCVGCGKCAESCPAKTISVINRKAKIDYSNCIKCFCCHEMCPVKAIDIKRFKLFDL